MALKTEKNLSISNFKILPKAALVALGMIFLLEVSAGLLMRMARLRCGGGDLVRVDTDFFCRNFRPLCDADPARDPRWKSRTYRSWDEMAEDGPFDAVVSGTSVGSTGWVEMLQAEGLKILNTTGNPEFRAFLPMGVWNLLDHSAKLNTRPGALLLYCALTERGDMDFRIPPESFRKKSIPAVHRAKEGPKFETHFGSFWTYTLKKIELQHDPEIKLIALEKGPEMLQTIALAGLRRKLDYSLEDERLLEEQFGVYRDEAARRGFRFAFVAFPTKPQMYEWLLGSEYRGAGRRPNLEAIQKACKKNGIPFLNVEKELARAAREHYSKDGTLLWLHCDTHMNDLGDRYTAGIVKKFIQDIQAGGASDAGQSQV